MPSKFEIAFEKLLQQEGGRVDDKDDPGGRTNMGITQTSYDAFSKLWNKPTKDVFDLTLDDARAFYITEYWSPMRLRQVEWQSLADALLSFGANQGRKVVVRRIQSILELTTDGIMGDKTISAINAAQPPINLLRAFLAATTQFYKRLIERRPVLAKFETGWMNRVYSCHVEVV